MVDLNLDFDIGTKVVSVGDSFSDNLGFSIDDSSNNNYEKRIDIMGEPKLNVTDGVELLSNTNPLDINTEKEGKNDDFSFFKVEDKGGIVDGDISNPTIDPKDDSFIMNNSSDKDDNGGYKPIHRLTPQEIKNEKIDLIYKFKKLEGQGIRTTMNYNMNSHLEDMRNEYN